MPLARVLEPEEMDRPDEAAEYDQMDFSATDQLFAGRAAELARPGGWIVDIGCGNAKIPLAIANLAPASPVCAVEMSGAMLAVAVRNRTKARDAARGVQFVRGDAKNLPFAAGSVSLVTSNSLIHHVPDPRDVFREIARIVNSAPSQPRVLVRDLVRPHSEADLSALVEKYSAGWSRPQRRLYEDSLHAALSLEEVRECAATAGLRGVRVEQITDRHWSLEPEDGGLS
ncbi:MAG TPA: class I SAM-dependent methyltransferase [Bryobacteraceae bacterium]|nr:class I SAM-dependent methyltransferase [Bryobacteraceae bacterium]